MKRHGLRESTGRSRRRALLLVPSAMMLIVIVGISSVLWGGWWTTDVTVSPPPPVNETLSADERSYYEYVAPRLREAAAEARFLARLGEERSRNIVELQTHRERLGDVIAEISIFADEHGVPQRFYAAHELFRAGAVTVSNAVRDGVDAFTSFDFARFGEIVFAFSQGADSLDDAADLLDDLGGSATSTPIPE